MDITFNDILHIDSVQLEQFCPEGSIKVADGAKTGLIKPMDCRKVEVKISGLHFNTPDSLVVEYINKHGTVVNTKVIYRRTTKRIQEW